MRHRKEGIESDRSITDKKRSFHICCCVQNNVYTVGEDMTVAWVGRSMLALNQASTSSNNSVDVMGRASALVASPYTSLPGNLKSLPPHLNYSFHPC